MYSTSIGKGNLWGNVANNTDFDVCYLERPKFDKIISTFFIEYSYSQKRLGYDWKIPIVCF